MNLVGLSEELKYIVDRVGIIYGRLRIRFNTFTVTRILSVSYSVTYCHSALSKEPYILDGMPRDMSHRA